MLTGTRPTGIPKPPWNILPADSGLGSHWGVLSGVGKSPGTVLESL